MLAKSKSYSDTPKLYSAHKTEAAHNILILPTIILPLLTIVLLISLSILPVSALTYQDEVDLQFTWNPTVNISLSGDLIISNLSPGSSSDSNIITVTAGSNDSHGYTLYSTVGNTTNSSTELRLDGTSTSNIFSSVTGNKAALTNFDDNTWGYSYCDYTSNANACDTTSNWVSGNTGSTTAGYNGLPLYSVADSSKVKLADTSSANQTTIKFKIGAKAANTQAVGTYTNTVNFIGVGKVLTTNYTLNYNGNGADTGTTPSSQSGSTTDGAITLSSSSPTKTDYIFKGWCDTDNTSDPTTCSGNTYEPGRIYIIPAASQGGTVTVNMYAIWKDNTPVYTLQQFAAGTASTTCAAMSTGDTLTLVDGRDQTPYTIGKLADNNCWLLDNLALDLTSSTVLGAMDSTNTNASDTTLGYLKNGGGTTSDKYATAKVANWTSSYSYSAPLVNMGYKDTVPTDATSTAGGYKIGGYYNYCAATAGSYCYGNGTSYGTSSGDATESICPKGWRLPTGNTSGEYQALYNNSNYNTYANYRAALHLPLSGYFDSHSPNEQGSGGLFWSSTRYDSLYMYDLGLDASSIYPEHDSGRDAGYSVRCVLGS